MTGSRPICSVSARARSSMTCSCKSPSKWKEIIRARITSRCREMKTVSTRRSREEILDLFRACQSKLGRTPGTNAFFKIAGVKPSEVKYYWSRPAALAEEAGALPNELQPRLSDEEVFRDYANLCLHLGKIPTSNEFRIAQREFKTRTHTAY